MGIVDYVVGKELIFRSSRLPSSDVTLSWPARNDRLHKRYIEGATAFWSRDI